MPRPIKATISLSALRHNLAAVTHSLKDGASPPFPPVPKVWAVMKANGYGHGLEQTVRGFEQADGYAMLDLNEAVRVRELGWTKPVMLLEGFFEPADLRVVDAYRLTVAVHCMEQLDMLSSFKPARPISALIKLDTGMTRLGFKVEDYPAAQARALSLAEQGILDEPGAMTHFARADDDPVLTRGQLDMFCRATEDVRGAISVCNSAAVLTPGLWATVPGLREQWIRPGVCLYGSSPFEDKTGRELGLRPVMTLSSRLISVRTISAGTSVGYGYRYTATESQRVGVVACGYADGYPRHAPTGTPIVVDGVRTRVLGRVSMDMLVADLTPVPQARIGSEVVLWGEGGPTIEEVAAASDTVGYELMCALAPRVPRQILD
jgi:alanine racemase